MLERDSKESLHLIVSSRNIKVLIVVTRFIEYKRMREEGAETASNVMSSLFFGCRTN